MTPLFEQTLASLLAERSGGHPIPLHPDLDLLDTGLLDSIGLLELIADLEKKIGTHVDLFDVDPDHLSTVGGLSQLFQQTSAH